MTKNRDIPLDRENTAEMLADVAAGADVVAEEVSWLGHSLLAGQLDFALLSGSIIEELKAIRPTARGHLSHLRLEHGLLTPEDDSIWRIAVPPEQ